MKSTKRGIFCVILTLTLCLSTIPVQAANPTDTAAVTRTAFASALWDHEGNPTVKYALTFQDVPQDAAYVEAVRWAASEKLMSGVGSGMFYPDGAITREQMAVILYRYAESLGMDVSVGEDTNILSYSDFTDRSDWAVSALQWALGSGVLDDVQGNLNARAAVTRTEIAETLERFDSVRISANLLNSWTENAKPKAALTEYMAAITDKRSETYIPKENRIAVFDLDGTLMCETYPRCFEYMVFVDYALNNPDYRPIDEVKTVAQEIVNTMWQEKPSGISTRQAAAAAVAYKGMTPAELESCASPL